MSNTLDVVVMLALSIATAGCRTQTPELTAPVGVSSVTAAPSDPLASLDLPSQPAPEPSVDPRALEERRAPPDFDAAKCLPRAPSFVFPTDSAIITPEQDLELHHLALCMNFGPMRGAKLVAVGHADAVGTIENNLQLAQQRAAKVKQFLVAHGVDAARVLVTSAGERSSEASAAGRRVDLLVMR